VYAYSADPRFSYCLYVPEHLPKATAPGLTVVIHDSTRNFMDCRDGFTDFGERHGQVVLAPLFPINVLGDGNGDGYKYFIEGGIRYDLLLNGMVEAVAAQTGCEAARFCLQGYSGGAQFAHRYLLLHPGRLRALSVGAPGEVTLLDEEADWWGGVRNLEAVFGRPLDHAALRQVPVHMSVGDEDTELDELAPAAPSRYWHSDAERRSANRIERLRTLERSFADAGISVLFELMPGVTHGAGPELAMTLAKRFLARHIG
jgi:poly(3-hydroxybutyrate) depolymerase